MTPELISEIVNIRIENRWEIECQRGICDGATGGKYSAGFVARDADGNFAFVKVLDPSTDRSLPSGERLKDLEERLAIFRYEADLLKKCKDRRVRRVVRLIAEGELSLPASGTAMHYLIMELADRDLREHASLKNTLNAAHNLRIAHQTCVALEQLHFHQLAHQDIKPSNVLIFSELKTKLGDLGHAHDRSVSRPGINGVVGGDPAYAPPEQLYGYRDAEWSRRRLAADLYLFGGLVVYLFTNISLTTHLANQLRPEHRWDVWPDTFEEVMPYVREAWAAALDDFADSVPAEVRSELVSLVSLLTDPDPSRRGHPLDRAALAAPFNLRRFSSRIQVLAARLDWGARVATPS